MSPAVQNLIKSFDHLPDSDKRTAASEILRRSRDLELPPLSDDDLIAAADSVFQELDRDEENSY